LGTIESMKWTREDLEKLEKEELIEIILGMQEMMLKLLERVQRLEDQLAKNSGNSSKPPSSDGLKKRPTSLREKGKRKSGGQAGHKGSTLKMVSTPDEMVLHEVSVCPHCQTAVSELACEGMEKRQVFDIPVVRLHVTEHQAQIKRCAQCHERVKASFPPNVTQAVQYGERIQAQAVYLSTYQLLPVARITELFEDLYGHRPSEALILQAQERVHAQLGVSLAQIRSQIQQAAVVHCDESGMLVSGRLNWLHVAATKHLTSYGLHSKRGQQAMRELDILPHLSGCAVHDSYSSYFQFEELTHALCNAHHLRDLKFITEQYQQTWAEEMAQLLLVGKAEIAHAPPQAEGLSPARLAHYDQAYDRILQQGWAVNPPLELPPTGKQGRKRQTPAQNLLARFQKHKTLILRFLADFRIPFDNNLAERDLRMMKVKQKVSGTFRTWRGAELFCDIRSYISTVRKQAYRVIHALHSALLGHPFLPA
jgi:transposase